MAQMGLEFLSSCQGDFWLPDTFHWINLKTPQGYIFDAFLCHQKMGNLKKQNWVFVWVSVLSVAVSLINEASNTYNMCLSFPIPCLSHSSTLH